MSGSMEPKLTPPRRARLFQLILALTSVAGATPPEWTVAYWDENLLQGPPPVEPFRPMGRFEVSPAPV